MDTAGTSPFHEGEQRVQSMLGVRDAIEPWARQVVRSFLPDEHRDFYAAQPFLVAAARDEEGRPWVTLLAGGEGFVRSADPRHLAIGARPLPGDALEHALEPGSPLGLLGIELATRRRNRVNGRVVESGAGALVFEVGQSFGNCPQYIHPREWRRVPPAGPPAPVRRSTRLDASMRAWIAAADTLFVGSGYGGGPEVDGGAGGAGRGSGRDVYGMDASHRGGEAGFVRVVDDTRLVLPDYAGNNHFNTIGNLVMDPRAGLLFVDFECGSLLQLTGRARIDWDSDAVAEYPGARRLIEFEVEAAVALESVLPLRWTAAAEAVHSLRIVGKVRESADVTSFVLAARDGGPLPGFAPGQHLPLVLPAPGGEGRVRRTYSLSGAVTGDRYRISVKREPHGLVSRHLHDAVEVGDVLEAAAPAGDFGLAGGDRPVVLASAGVGVTPMVAMLHALADPGESRDVWFIHGARDGAHHALAEEVRRLVAGSPRLRLHVAYSRPAPDDGAGGAYDTRGRVDADLLARLLPGLDAEFYLCGPTPFMAGLRAGLREAGVPDGRIHAESFGPES